MAVQQPPLRGPLAFADARGCKEWLNALALTNIPQAQMIVLETLRALNGADFDGMERLKCLELMRDKIAFLQGEQRARYFGKTIPLSANDANAWSNGRSLLEEMEAGYRRCREEAQAGAGELARLGALLTQRIVRYIGTQMLFHALVYRRFDPQLWMRLHQEYAISDGAHTLAETVKDSLESADGTSGVMDAYAQVVLFQAAFLSQMTSPQMDFAEALLKLWVHGRVRVLAAPAEADTAKIDPLVVDLARDIGARPQPRPDFKEGQRIIDTSQLSRTIRKRIQGLEKGEDAVALGLPPQTGALDPIPELKRLHKLWCEGAPPRPPGKPAQQEKAGLVFGMTEIHFFVSGGKVFEQPDKPRELTQLEKQDIEVFGRITERTQSRMVTADHNYSVEGWAVVDEMLGAVRVQRPQTSSRGVAIGRLVAVRLGDTAPFFLGMVSELVTETDGRIIATITMFPGKPAPVAVRASDSRNRTSTQWVQALGLPALEKINVPATFVVPSGMGTRGRGVHTWVQGMKESTVEDIVDHGADFDRIKVF
jgi:hypothetical protein